MKTAISLPDELFKAAEFPARRLGVSRSRLYATALEITSHDIRLAESASGLTPCH